MRLRYTLTFATLAAWISAPATFAQAGKISAEESEFFESKIRPVLIEHCYECHSAATMPKAKAGLLLDTKEGTLKGGSAGAAIVPGNAEQSISIKRIRMEAGSDDIMPPASKPRMRPDQIADLVAWVKMGAPDPRSGKQSKILSGDSDIAQAKQHWSFVTVKAPTIPNKDTMFNGKLASWVQNPVDAFILSKIEEKGLLPSLPAERWTLIRRTYYDLTGLPPSFEDAKAFIEDESADAYEKVVDRLLASPQYGERWGRYWLDVARYADTTGANGRRGQMTDYIYAYTYRDWVINSLNKDMPYDKFLVNQIAADKLPKNDEAAAMGFLTLGRRDRNQMDVIDDQIDVLTRGVMGVSVYCSRCHDHKFDPIPTADYYSMVGVFTSSIEPPEMQKPVLWTDPAALSVLSNTNYANFQMQLKKIEGERVVFHQKSVYDYETHARTNSYRYMLWDKMYKDSKKQFKDRGDEQDFERQTKMFGLKFEVFRNWQRYMAKQNTNDPVFALWFAYGQLPTNRFAIGAQTISKTVAERFEKNTKLKPINSLVLNMFSKVPPQSFSEVGGRYQQLLEMADIQWRRALAAHAQERAKVGNETLAYPISLQDAEKRFGLKFEGSTEAWEQLRMVVYGSDSPGQYTWDQLKRMDNNRLEREDERKFADTIEDLKMNHTGSPPRAMVLNDSPNLRNERIRIKGGNTLGKEVPRQFLEVLSGPDRKPYSNGSGRLEMAQAIANKDNPLTARVMVNRIWMHHFGQGIVPSINEFGLRSAGASNQELLDYLAWYFVENGWSLKKLHRHLMLTSTYQQSSEDNPRNSLKDSGNVFMHKMSRRRLEFEAFRDTLLSVSGKLDTTLGGRPVNLSQAPYPYRRTVYGYVDRRNLDDMFRTFDFANPDSTTAQRFTSTVAQQALFMMNSPMVADLANKLVNRPEFKATPGEQQRIAQIYQVLYQRMPEPIEMKLGALFLEEQTGEKTVMTSGATWQQGYGQYAESSKQVRFYQFPYTDGKVYQGSSRRPDQNFGNLHLSADGGHPGIYNNVTVIRRWTAPRDTTVEINGNLKHELSKELQAMIKTYKEKKMTLPNYDGVMGFIVHTRAGRGAQIWSGDANGGTANAKAGPVPVKKGDTLDFIVHCKSNHYQDQFTWNPSVKVTAEVAQATTQKTGSMMLNEWISSEEFAGQIVKPKPLNAWEKYVQVLLLSNELAFVD